MLMPVVSFAQGSHSLQNPVSGYGTIGALFSALLNIIIVVAVPVVVLFLILAGFRYVTARGNPNGIQEANTALLYGVIGGVIIIGAVALLAIIQSTVNQFTPAT